MDSFFDYTRMELTEFLGRRPGAAQLYKSVYRGHVDDFAKLDTLAVRHKSMVAERFSLSLPVVTRRFESADGTVRYLIRLADGEVVESVLIPEDDRITFCISSQVGCGLACAFCLTGQMGLTRNLSCGEIVSQVLLLQRETASHYSERISVVFMGMGEPLQNYENVLKAIHILQDNHGLSIPLRRITLSTAGLLPGIERLAREPLFPNLSISLTGATHPVRDRLMPVNRRYPISEVIAAVRKWPVSRQKRVMVEYVMMRGVTDSLEDAECLSATLRGMRLKVNLIPLNSAPEIPFQRSEHMQVLRFQQVLLGNGIATFMRKTRGGDVSGACGQLKGFDAPPPCTADVTT